ncbi:MAG: cytidylate kinase-like family protein [Candidatus Dormibacteraceae bacterium]
MPVITIGREFGAGGDTVGHILAERLGLEVYDSKIVDEVAHRLGIGVDVVESYDEQTGSLLDRLLRQLATVDFSTPQDVAAWTPPYGDPAFDPRRSVLQLTQEVIRRAADDGDAVIVGRGGAYVLLDRPEVLRVFLRANLDFRVKAIMESRKLDEAAARKYLRERDANSAEYIKQVYGHDWHHASHYDLVLDTGRLGHLRAVEVILAALPK